MLHEGTVYLVEVNPRFQGSSMLAARIDRRMGRPDLFLCHLAAFLGLEPPDMAEGVPELAASQPELAHIICHNIRTTMGSLPDGSSAETIILSTARVQKLILA